MQNGGRKDGFTIVELLIVIVVIAILAAITMVAYVNFQQRAYNNRALSELSYISRAIQFYYADKGEYPPDADRGIPVAIFQQGDGEEPPSHWPEGPWPDSIYDYDHHLDEDDNPIVQISIRFCPVGGPLSACNFPNEPWTEDFDVNSSAYWCIAGNCRSHSDHPLTYPGYCMNCNED